MSSSPAAVATAACALGNPLTCGVGVIYSVFSFFFAAWLFQDRELTGELPNPYFVFPPTPTQTLRQRLSAELEVGKWHYVGHVHHQGLNHTVEYLNSGGIQRFRARYDLSLLCNGYPTDEPLLRLGPSRSGTRRSRAETSLHGATRTTTEGSSVTTGGAATTTRRTTRSAARRTGRASSPPTRAGGWSTARTPSRRARTSRTGRARWTTACSRSGGTIRGSSGTTASRTSFTALVRVC